MTGVAGGPEVRAPLPPVALDRPVLVEVPVGRMPRPHFFAPRRTKTKYER